MSLHKPAASVPRKSALILGIVLANASMVLNVAAAPVSYTTPNVKTTAGSEAVTLGGQTFTNHGLQGVARMTATTTLDFNGDTFGAFSAMDVIPGSWRRTANGSYTGTLVGLPDRGPNGVGQVTLSDYPGRLNNLALTFTPYTSATSLPVSADSQKQMVLTQAGGMLLKDFNGRVTTGLDPGTGSAAFVTQNGMSLPGSTTGIAANKIALDAEGLRFRNDGNFYVSDEYGANVYYFDKSGTMLGVIQPPAALMPRTATGAPSFSSLADSVTGRRLNQGLEGLSLTPDNRKLATLLQSATMQDSTTSQQTRTNTRLMIYDITGSATPTAPTGHYVLQLPVFTSTGNGGAVNRTAAQSELLALNDTQFLVLSRDGNGLGQANLNPVYKSILLIDIAGATNLAGTTYETSTTPISPGGNLLTTITPVQQVEVVNMLNTTQLGKFGLNINNVAPTRLTLTEKLEGMALVPVLDESAPQDYFLMIGNDNDFLSSTCKVGGLDCAQPVNSDALVLVYRVTLPTYAEPQYLRAMMENSSQTIGMNAQVAHETTLASADAIGQHLGTLRHLGGTQGEAGAAAWFALNGENDSGSDTTETSTVSVTLGLDGNVQDNLLLGAAFAWLEGSANNGGFSEDYDAWQLSAYAAYRNENLYATATATWSDLSFEDIIRPAAYGMAGMGETEGEGLALSAEAGYLTEQGNMLFGPLVGLRYLDTTIDAYLESGAAGGNVSYPEIEGDDITGYVGGEASILWSGMRAIGRVTYNAESDSDEQTATLRMPSINNAMATQAVPFSAYAQAYMEASLTVTGEVAAPLQWWVNYGARFGEDDGTEQRASIGFRMQF